jgi:hypothetical protein
MGTWKDSTKTVSYTFSSHNLVLASSYTSIDFAVAFRYATINETSSATYYELVIIVNGSGITTTSKYAYTQRTSTRMICAVTSNGITTSYSLYLQ